jgi:hypothetical protein
MKKKQTNILEVSKIFEDIIDNAKSFEGSDRGCLLTKDNQILERNVDFFYKNKSFNLTIIENK